MMNKLDCCVVRDLLPSFVEDLTEAETAAQVRAHLEQCPSCRAVEKDMRTQLPVERAPKRALRFLKRVKRTRLMAALLSALAALFCMWWLYDQEFHYANTEAGRLAAVCDYILSPKDSTIPYGIKAGTPLHVVSWKTIENRLFIFLEPTMKKTSTASCTLSGGSTGSTDRLNLRRARHNTLPASMARP